MTPLLWNSPAKYFGVGSHFLLRGIFSTQGSNPGLLTGQEKKIRINESLGVWCKHILFETGQPNSFFPA